MIYLKHFGLACCFILYAAWLGLSVISWLYGTCGLNPKKKNAYMLTSCHMFSFLSVRSFLSLAFILCISIIPSSLVYIFLYLRYNSPIPMILIDILLILFHLKELVAYL